MLLVVAVRILLDAQYLHCQLDAHAFYVSAVSRSKNSGRPDTGGLACDDWYKTEHAISIEP